MTKTFEPLTPKVILGIVAHPDDMEFGMSGTVARYIAEGAEAYYFILTNANKGTADRSIAPEQLRDIRRNEQRDACKVLGVKDVFFGDQEDGQLEVTQQLKADIVRVIRTVRPDVVFTIDPTFMYDADRGIVNHPDHRAAGQAVLDAVYPLARDHLTFPDLLDKEGLEPHKVQTVLMSHFGHENFFVDVSEYMDTKLAAVAAHASQFSDMEAIGTLIRQFGEQMGNKVGGKYAEGFVRVDIR